MSAGRCGSKQAALYSCDLKGVYRYKRRLTQGPEVLFLTNDADNRRRAAQEGLTAMSTAVHSLQQWQGAAWLLCCHTLSQTVSAAPASG